MKDHVPAPGRIADPIHFACCLHFLFPQIYMRVGDKLAFIKFLCMRVVSSSVVISISFSSPREQK